MHFGVLRLGSNRFGSVLRSHYELPLLLSRKPKMVRSLEGVEMARYGDRYSNLIVLSGQFEPPIVDVVFGEYHGVKFILRQEQETLGEMEINRVAIHLFSFAKITRLRNLKKGDRIAVKAMDITVPSQNCNIIRAENIGRC